MMNHSRVAILLLTAMCCLAVFVSASDKEMETLASTKVVLKDGDRIVFIGDSLTHLGGLDAPKEHVTKGYVRLVREALQERHKDKNIEVDWGAKGGYTTQNLLRSLEVFALKKQPTIVVVWIGTNDVKAMPSETYQNNLQEIIDRLQDARIQVVLCTLTVRQGEQHDGSNKFHRRLEEFSEIVRQTAKKRQLPLIDLRKATVEYLKKNNPDIKARGVLTYDGTHFNDAGNRFVAEQMLKSFQ